MIKMQVIFPWCLPKFRDITKKDMLTLDLEVSCLVVSALVQDCLAVKYETSAITTSIN